MILVANVGSTSFKYKLFDGESIRAEGRLERIGDNHAPQRHEIDGETIEDVTPLPEYADAIRSTLDRLSASGLLTNASDLDAVGFKTVHIRGEAGTLELTEDVLARMADYNDLAPAHNPPYIEAIRVFRGLYPDLPLIGLFEPAFHTTLPDYAYIYSVPYSWYEKHGVRKYGFHGASHRYVSERVADLIGRDDLRIVTCHLGGSASLCAVKAGRSVDTTMGLTPQCGVVNATRNGTIDPFIIPFIMRREAMDIDAVCAALANESGLLGISGVSGDVRDLEAAEADGNDRARLALDAFAYGTRKEIASMAAAMGGLDAIAFAGGIGERSATMRARICAGLGFLGIRLDPERNTDGPDERQIDQEAPVSAWVIPTDEERIVARAVQAFLAT